MPEVRDQIKTQTAASTPNKKRAQGLTFRRLFTKPGVSPYNEVEWEFRDAQITDAQGGMIFEQKNVEVPKDWSMTATNIVASKYLHGQIGTPERETGVRQLVAELFPWRIDLRPPLFESRPLPVRRSSVGAPHCPHHRRHRQGDLRAEGCRGAHRLVHDRDQHRRQQVSPWPARHAAARNRSSPAHRPCRRDRPRLGPSRRILRHR